MIKFIAFTLVCIGASAAVVRFFEPAETGFRCVSYCIHLNECCTNLSGKFRNMAAFPGRVHSKGKKSV